jgi:hypothetical protein
MTKLATVLITLLTLVSVAPLHADDEAASKGPLDGKVFKGKTGVSGDKKSVHDDTIVFKAGQFWTTSGEKEGFGNSSYTAYPDGSNMMFDVTVFSAKGERLTWKGTIKGSTVSAKIQRHLATGKNEDLWFTGKLSK